MFFLNRLLIRIILSMVVLFFVSTGVYLVLFVQSEFTRNTTELLKNGTTFAELNTPALYQDYLTTSSNGFPRFQDIAAGRLQKNTDVVSTMLLATNGKVIFDSKDFSKDSVQGRTATATDVFMTDVETLKLLQSQTTTQRNIQLNGEKLVEVVVPIIEAGNSHVFSMRYLLSFRSLEQRKMDIYKSAVLSFLPLFIFIVFSGILLAVSITKPIERLYSATQKISTGDYTVQVKVDSKDEIGQLGYAFNRMVLSLGEAQVKLKESNQNLEKQVLERTAQLQANLSELTRMNHLMVGRELKMAELKKENEQLNQKLASNGIPLERSV